MPPTKGPGGKFVKKGAEPAPEQPSATTAPPAAPMAEGGPIEPGQTAVVGEAGPEEFIPPAQGEVLPRCPATDAGGKQCLYVIHADLYPHLFSLEAASPALANPEPLPQAAIVPVGRVKDTGEMGTWWCGRCDNAQLLNNKAVCSKCGAIPSGI